MMGGLARRLVVMRTTTLRLWLLLLVLLFKIPTSLSSSSLVVGESSALKLSSGFPVKNFPATTKLGSSVICDRVHIHGLSRLNHLNKFAHSLKLQISRNTSHLRHIDAQVCFHGNVSLGLGMCSQGKWDKVDKGLWVRRMSLFDHKLLDVCTTASSLEMFEVTIEEEFSIHRAICLMAGILLLTVACPLSKSLMFYYSSAMAIGVFLVILMVLFQGMKLLPTGRKNSLAIFLYSSMVGLGSVLLRYFPGLLRSLLVVMEISEDMYNPLVTFLVAFVFLAGAWLGFLVVRKLVLTEDGSVDTSTSNFVSWSIRILALLLTLQSSFDPVLAAEAMIFALIVSVTLRKVARLKFLRRVYRKSLKLVKNISSGWHLPDLWPSKDSNDGYMLKTPEYWNYSGLRSRSNFLEPTLCNSSVHGLSDDSFSDGNTFASIIHKTPERRKFSRAEWEGFTRVSTQKAIEELVDSPGFSKWVAANTERISVTPKSKSNNASRSRRWLPWS